MTETTVSTRAGTREWLQLGVLSLAVLLVAIDGTVLNLAIPEITADLNPTASQMLWVIDIYSLMLAGLLVTAGSLSDRFGRKRVLMIGSTVFAAASALAAFSTSPEMLIAARVLMAVGGATILPSTLALIRNIFRDRSQRRVAIGIWSAMAGAGAALGPIVGGVLLENFWWGSVFLINVPLLVLFLIVGAILLPEHRDPKPGKWDPLSAVLSIVGLMGVVYAIKSLAEGINVTGVVVLVVGIAALVIFVRRQLRLQDPLIDVTLFTDRSFTGAVTGNLFSLVALSAMLLFLSQYFQLVQQYGPLESGIRLLPMTAGIIVAAPFTAKLIDRFGVRITVVAGLVIAAAAMFGFSSVVGTNNYPAVAVFMILIGVGVGIGLTATSDAIVSAAPPSKSGAASSISETAYELGTGLGIAILGTVVNVQYRSMLGEAPEAARESLAGAFETAPSLAPAEAESLLSRASDAFVAALSGSSIISGALLAVAAVLAFLLISKAGLRESPHDPHDEADESAEGTPRAAG